MAVRRYYGVLNAEDLQMAVDDLRRGYQPFAIVESLLEIAYPRSNEPIIVDHWRRGRVFTTQSELAWEQVGSLFEVVWLSEGDEESLAGLNEGGELANVEAITRTLDLWGPDNTRLPDRPNYPINGGRPVACVCEYRDQVSGRLVAYRYVALEAQ